MFSPASFKFTSFKPVSFKGLLIEPVVEEEQDQGRWAGEWLPIPVPKRVQPALPPKRKARVIASGPSPLSVAAARVINPVRVSVRIVASGPSSAITCQLDTSIVDEEDAIIAALAALL
jgi:hypothetical protein